ncbi:hypothetical protein COLO4_38414 [Corchorus olitorius]|uniref:Uncharacterized protein n=1 Tax=Corchorus olitorius TaxID=93759 RepID=A0A1R3FV68_9ROSI|nr:hypothetical protein COLO4_38414 [Corchorus olitorius]
MTSKRSLVVASKSLATTIYQSIPVGQSSYSQTTTAVKNYDKQTGCYSHVTNMQVISSGETFKERSTGRVGFKDEYKTTST